MGSRPPHVVCLRAGWGVAPGAACATAQQLTRSLSAQLLLEGGGKKELKITKPVKDVVQDDVLSVMRTWGQDRLACTEEQLPA